MKHIALTFSLLVVLASCGKDNKVSSSTQEQNAVITPISNLVNFEGVYDLVRMESNDCGASIRIVQDCNGYQLISNHSMEIEEFCNVNKGEFRTNIRYSKESARDRDSRDSRDTRYPSNPDRNPPNPDSNENTTVVTQEGNQIRAVLRLSPSIAFTNTLTLTNDGILTKNSQLKSRTSRCIYQRR